MNALPTSRRVIHGRTFSRTYYPSDYDPVQMYPRPKSIRGRLSSVLLACALGVAMAAVMFFGQRV
jgi:hypothetical protein